MGSGFQSLTKPPQVDYATRGVQPPAALAVSTNDQIVIKVHNSNAAPGLQLFYRLLLADGTIVPGQQALPADATRAVNTFTLGLEDGFLLSAVVFSTATSVFRGQCYVRVLVFRGSLTQLFVGHLLAEGYVTTATAIGFPIGPQEYAVSGRGVIRSISGTTPAAGAELSETVPTGAIWRLVSFTAKLTTDATVNSRTPLLFVNDGTSNVAVAPPGTTIGASVAVSFAWSEFAQPGSQRSNWIFSYCPVIGYLPAGFLLQTITQNLAAGDQWSTVRYLVEEWIQP